MTARLTLDDCPDPHWILEPRSLRILAVNPACCAHYGFPAHLFAALTPGALCAEEDGKALEAFLRTGAARPSPWRTWRHKRSDGTTFWADIHAACVEWEGEACLLVCVRDVTALLDAAGEASPQQDPSHSEQLWLLEAGVARINDIILICSGDALDEPKGPRVVYVNDAFERVTGYSREHILGKTPRILQGPATDRSELNRIRAALEGRQPVRSELVNYTQDGHPYWTEIEIVHLERRGEPYFVAVQRDITQRKLAEQEHAALAERLHLVAHATHDVVWDWDVQGGTLWWNGGYERLFGHVLSPDNRGLSSWTEHIVDEDRERVLATLDAAIQGDATMWQDEYGFRRADGRVLIISDRGFLVRDESCRVTRMIGHMTDITAKRAFDERLRQAQKLEAIGQLTGGIAHDFNNLLTVILGNAELLVEDLDGRPHLQAMARLGMEAALRGAELTRRLLAFARQQPLAPQRVSLNDQVLGMRALLRRTLPEDIEIELRTGADLWVVEVDAGQVEVALLNLALNARDAMPTGGLITIETSNVEVGPLGGASVSDLESQEVPPGDYVRISLRDTGEGIPPENMERVFEPFFTTKEGGRGSGLGLPSVFGFMKQSGGHLTITSDVSVGTQVDLYFPRADAGGVSAAAPPTLAPVGLGNETVLVVEDDQHVRAHVVSLLTSLGYRVRSAGSAAEALDVLRASEDIDLLFTDVVIPGGLNGPQLAAQALTLRPQLRVLFTSGYAQNSLAEEARIPRPWRLLSKPYRQHELASCLRAALGEAHDAPSHELPTDHGDSSVDD